MTHIHLPDGVFPIWLWVLGFIITITYIGIAIKSTSKKDINKNIPLIAIMSAIMTVAMSIHIIPPFYHINTSAIIGIILGPIFSPISIFVVNSILALLGHGGVSTIGINTIVISAEAIFAYYLFSITKKYFKKIFISAFISTFISLALASLISVGIVLTGTKHIEVGCCKCNHHEPVHKNEHHEHTEFNIKKFIKLIITFGLAGWLIESLVTGFIIDYIYKIKPTMIEKK